MSSNRIVLIALLLVAPALVGCNSMWEAMGYEKRELLVSDVKEARDEQNKAKEEIKTTMQAFKEVTNFQGGDLEAKYEKLSDAYDDAKSRADKVSSRIKDVEKTANALFEEWQEELGEYKNPDLKAQSQQKLTDTKVRYKQLLGVMKQAESKMKPVLGTFNDQVLFLKHNLNAAAITSLQGTAATMDAEVGKLIADMEASIKEANDFIATIEKS